MAEPNTKMSFTKVQREGVKVTSSSCKGAGARVSAGARIHPVHPPRSTGNYSFRKGTLWQKAAQNKYGNIAMHLPTLASGECN